MAEAKKTTKLSPTQTSPYLKALSERVLVYDGAMGTELQKRGLTAEDYGGPEYEGCPEILVRTRPDVIREIHASYLEAGADVIETNTFGVLPHVLAEYGLEAEAEALAEEAARLAREVADAYTTPERPRFVAGALGPGTKLISLGQIDWDTLYESYRTAARGLLRGGVDLILLETAQDVLQIKAAVFAVRQAMRDVGREVPIQAQVTFETTGTMLVGTDPEAALAALEALGVDVAGMNCATGPDLMDPHVRTFTRESELPISVLPNAGLPEQKEGRIHYPLTPDALVRWQKKFVTEYGASVVGGCCGTGPEHIRALAEALALHPQVRPPKPRARRAVAAGLYQAVPLRFDAGLLMVGERLNATGSKKFRELLFTGDFEGIKELAREQVEEGAHMLDVSTAWTGRDEKADMEAVLRAIVPEVPVPIMVDTTSPEVLEAALKLVPGRPAVNSVNFEDGEERFDRVARLARDHGALVVALTIGEGGMAKTVEEKVALARRMHRRLTEVHGFLESEIFFDLLTFPITQGDEETRRLALWTLEAIRVLKEEFPEAGFILGISNVSFGLRPRARKVLNSVFLHEAERAGLTAAIVHPGKILPVSEIPEKAYQLALDLIYDRREKGYDPLFAFIEYFEKETAKGPETEKKTLPVEERLKEAILKGRKKGLEEDLDEALKKYRAEAIVNEILLPAMKVVGDLFGEGKMQLPFVLKSAEAMKAAVAHLEPHMEKKEGARRGKIVLATVKGDVHDIGKNLVGIILANNGFEVVDLGIKQPVENILRAIEEHRPDAVGMSGLLVKSTQVMRENLEVMAERGYRLPVLLGGAALTRRFVEEDLKAIYPRAHYAQDAFEGLKILQDLSEGKTPEEAKKSAPAKVKARARRAPPKEGPPPPPRVPRPPFFGVRYLGPAELPIPAIAKYLNKRALFRGQWGFKRGKIPENEYQALVAREAEPILAELLPRGEELLEPKVAYGYFPVAREGEALLVFSEAGEVLARIAYPVSEKGLSIARYHLPRHGPLLGGVEDWMPKGALEAGARDVAVFFVVTVGDKGLNEAKRLLEAGRYQDYLFTHGYVVEMAEALAEYWHKRLREEWGIAAGDASEIEKLFQKHYQGARYAPGYPAWPELEAQATLARLLNWERIGIGLTEDFQLVPEASTSGIAVHHPEARYFSVG